MKGRDESRKTKSKDSRVTTTVKPLYFCIRLTSYSKSQTPIERKGDPKSEQSQLQVSLGKRVLNTLS